MRPLVGEATKNLLNEQQSDIDFLCSLQSLTSLGDVIVDGDSSFYRLVHGPIVNKPMPPSSSRRRRRRPQQFGPKPQSPLRSDENAASRLARRSLFGRRTSPLTTSTTPLRDIGNTTPKSSYRRCASDTAANDWVRLSPTPLTKIESVSTNVLTAVTDNDDDQRLVGDFTRPLCLPVVNDNKHCDLNTISHHTVVYI